MKTDIRQLEINQAIEILHFLSSYAFTPTPPLPEFDQYAERIRHRKGAEYFAFYENDQPVAISCATTPLIQNIRGMNFKMGGIANVATHPASRRKGYVRRLMHYMYRDFLEKDYAVSCLYPFKEAFYQKLGYIPLPQAKKITFNSQRLKPILDMNQTFSYELLSFYEGYSAFRDYLLDHQAKTHGMALFNISQPEAAKDHHAWLLFAKRDEQTIGVMNYVLKDQMMTQTLQAYDFLYSNTAGKYALLNWIARHIDQVEKVVLHLKTDILGENLFTDIRPEFEGIFVPAMARVIDFKQLNGLEIGNGVISIALKDPDCEWNTGIWQLSAENGVLDIIKAQKADCALTIHGLTALVYGVYDPEEFNLRGWGTPNEKQQQILREMFPPLLPYLHAMY